MGARTVTAKWVNPNGTPAAFAVATFEIDPSTYDPDEMVLGSDPIDVTADAQGIMGAELWTNADGLEPSRWTVTWPSGRQDTFVLPAGEDPISLRELLAMQLIGWPLPDVTDAIDIEISGLYDALANTSDALLGDALIGTLSPPVIGVARTVHDKLADIINVYDVIPKSEIAAIRAGTSSWDATVALQTIFDYAYANNRTVVCDGGTFVISATLRARSNMDFRGVRVSVASATIVAFELGDPVTPLARLRCALPRVYRTTYTASSNDWGSSVGVRIRNIRQSLLLVPHAFGFDSGVQLYADDGNACAYNEIHYLQLENNKVGLRVTPIGTGHCNENEHVGGRFSLASNHGSRLPGTRCILLDGATPNAVNNNRFRDMSLEGDPEYKIEVQGGSNNLWDWCRYENFAGTPNGYVKYGPFAGINAQDNVIWYGYDSDKLIIEDTTPQIQNHLYTAARVNIHGRSTVGVIRGSNLTSTTAPIFAATARKNYTTEDTSPLNTWTAAEIETIWKASTDANYRAKLDHVTGLFHMSALADAVDTMRLAAQRLQIIAAGVAVALQHPTDENAPLLQLFDDGTPIGTVTPSLAAASYGQLHTKLRRPGDAGYRLLLDHSMGQARFGDAAGELWILDMGGASGGTFIFGWTLTGGVTPAQPWNVSTAALASALVAAGVTSGSVAVTGTPGVQYLIRFTSAYVNSRIPAPTVDASAITGNTVPVTLAPGDPWIGRQANNVLLFSDAWKLNPSGIIPAAGISNRGFVRWKENASGSADRLQIVQKNANDAYGWADLITPQLLLATSAYPTTGFDVETNDGAGGGVGTADTVIFTTIIPGGTLGTINKIRVRMNGKLLNNSGGSVTLQVRVRYGGIVIANITTTAIATNPADRQVRLDVELSGRHATNAQTADAQLVIPNAAGSAGVQTAAATVYTSLHMTTALNVNSNSDQTFNISVAMTPAGTGPNLVKFTASTVHIEQVR